MFLDSLGTSEALLVTAKTPPLSTKHRYLGFVQTSACVDDNFYLIGSGLNRSGGAIEWACRTIGAGVSRDALLGEAMAEPPGSGGVLFVPNLAGSTAPNPDSNATGAFVGLTDATRRGTMFRAVLEGVAMEARMVSDALFSLPGVGKPDELRVIGGGIRNSLFLQIKASVLGRSLVVCEEPEMTAVGAALLGGIGAGLWPTFQDALSTVKLSTFEVLPNAEWTKVYDELYSLVYSGLHLALGAVNRGTAAFR